MKPAALLLFALACVLTPLCVGGALPWWTIALGGLVTAGLLAIGLSGSGGLRGPLLWLLAVPALASAAQLVPLPAAWLAVLSPQAAQLRGVAGLPPWAPLSVDAPATAFALCRAVMLC